MPVVRRQVLFIQGGGPGAHDDWDAKLVASLGAGLGDGYDIRYPRMPHEDEPDYALWSAAVQREVAVLDDDAVAIGHSVGGAVLVATLARRPPERRLGAIVLVATPFVGRGGWASEEYELGFDLGTRLPAGVPVHLFHGSQDDTVPSEHVDLFVRAVPQLQVHRLPGRDHQLGDDLTEVAQLFAGEHR